MFKRNLCGLWVANRKDGNYFEGGKTILKLMLDLKERRWRGLDSASSEEKRGGSYEASNKILGSPKCGEFLDFLRNVQTGKNGFVSWS